MGTITDRDAERRWVHAGLNCAAVSSGIGFDTGHSGDYWPGMDTRLHYGTPAIVWDLSRLYAEVESVANQLASLTSLPDPESSWDCTEAEFRRLMRESRAWRRIKASRQAVSA